MKHLAETEFMALFDESVHEEILRKVAEYQATHIVCYECLDMCSSHLGERKALMIGPNNTRKNLDHAKHNIDAELCSTIKWPTAYMVVGEEG